MGTSEGGGVEQARTHKMARHTTSKVIYNITHPKVDISKAKIQARFPFYSESYFRDYTGIVLVVMALACLYAANVHNRAAFFLGDPSISLPLSDSKGWVWDSLAAALVAVQIAVFRKDLELLHSLCLSLAASAVSSIFVALVLSCTTGTLTPDFLARCSPPCMENISWVFVASTQPNNSIAYVPAQCGFADPRHGNTLFACPDPAPSVLTACSQLLHLPLWDSTQCTNAEGSIAHNFSVANGYSGIVSLTVAYLSAVCLICALLMLGRARNPTAGLAAAAGATLPLVLSAGYEFSRGGHSLESLVLSVVLGFGIAAGVHTLYFTPFWEGSVPRRRPRQLVHYVREREELDSETDSDGEGGDLHRLEQSLFGKSLSDTPAAPRGGGGGNDNHISDGDGDSGHGEPLSRFEALASNTRSAAGAHGVGKSARGLQRGLGQRGKLRKSRIQATAFWDPNFKEKTGKQGLSGWYLVRKFFLREWHLSSQLFPAAVLVWAVVLLMFFVLFFQFTESSVFVIWACLTVELLLFPLFQACAMEALFWDAEFGVVSRVLYV